MAISRRKFNLKFKSESAHRVIGVGRSPRAPATELFIEENSVAKWVLDDRRRLQALEGSNDVPLTRVERAELLRFRASIVLRSSSSTTPTPWMASREVETTLRSESSPFPAVTSLRRVRQRSCHSPMWSLDQTRGGLRTVLTPPSRGDLE